MIPCHLCKDAQACCGVLIFPKDFIDKFKDKIEKNPKKIVEIDTRVIYLYDDERCPFLDRNTRLCKVYNNRPDVCKEYGNTDRLPCPYFKRSGNKRSKASENKVLRQISKDVDLFQDIIKQNGKN